MVKAQKILAAVTAIACFAALVPWIIVFWSKSFSTNPADWGVFGDYIGGVLSGPLALAGFVALLITIQQQRAFAQAEQNKANDLKYFESAQKCLERAYETICPTDAKTPPKNRMAWLTTARWLLSANTLAARISGTSPALKEAFDLEAEHYRMMFCEFLKPLEMCSVFTEHSFFEGDHTRSGSELEERSVRVILEFMEWPEEKADAITKVSQYTRNEVESMHAWLRGFQAYLLGKRRFQKTQQRDDV